MALSKIVLGLGFTSIALSLMVIVSWLGGSITGGVTQEFSLVLDKISILTGIFVVLTILALLTDYLMFKKRLMR